MRKTLALLLIAGLLALAAVFWAGRRGGQLPDWYLEARAAEALAPDLEVAARRAQQVLVARFGRELLDDVTADDGTPDESFLERIKRRGQLVLEGLREGREMRLGARDLEDIILSMAYENEDGSKLLAATKAVRAQIGGKTANI